MIASHHQTRFETIVKLDTSITNHPHIVKGLLFETIVKLDTSITHQQTRIK